MKYGPDGQSGRIWSEFLRTVTADRRYLDLNHLTDLDSEAAAKSSQVTLVEVLLGISFFSSYT